MAHPQHQSVRERYAFRCGYCGVTETDAGGELTVDHFRPTSAGGDDHDTNLVYACIRCNQYKGALLPNATDPVQEQRLLHPLFDDLTIHLSENEATGLLEGLTAAGRFHVLALRLNRPTLVANRQRRHLIALLEAQLNQIRTENTELRERLIQREHYIAALQRRLNLLVHQEDSE